MKKYIKKKSSAINPNAPGPKYRTPDHFKGSKFSGKGKTPSPRFKPGQFKIQHKG